jgi:serine-type D-Ala-D-Ala carboxypeptidase/endopeptidase (penicillin-binding protein 4)
MTARNSLLRLLGASLTLPALALPLHAQVVGSTTEAWSPTLPPSRAIQRTPLATLPPLPAPNGLPQLQSEVSCPGLQQRLVTLIGAEAPVWSVSVADPSGRLLADVNGTRARVPASNQKLLSTAFALDRLGPDFRLNTRRLTGQGDPDLAVPHLQRFAKLALASSGGVPGTAVKLQLAEEPAQGWWPQGWSYGDRSYAYGAPITRLAITSNAIEDAVSNPPSRLSTLLRRAMTQQGAKAQLSLVPADAPLPRDAVLVHEEPSINMHGLLSLANTESHNFTAEVLLRSAAGTWNVEDAARLETVWLKGEGLPMQGVSIHDGSGLSRNDRLTSRLLAALLLRMDQHPYGRDYIGSMSIAGQRGTMRHLYNGTSLDGRLFGKTGTLTGVRAISGVLQTSAGPRYVSAISNGASMPNQTIGQIMRQVQNVSLCP